MLFIKRSIKAAPAATQRLREEIEALREEKARLITAPHLTEAPQGARSADKTGQTTNDKGIYVGLWKPADHSRLSALSLDKVGQRIGNKGIYVGLWKPTARNGQSLGKTFYVFAAPTDLDPPDATGKNCRTFLDAAREVGARQNWHNHNGIYCENDTALYAALKDGSALGKWFIPTLDLLRGKDIYGYVVRDKHLFGLQNEGDLKGTFTINDEARFLMFPRFYWSCTEFRYDSTKVWNVRFSDGGDGWNDKDVLQLSCRPVRVELATTPVPAP